MPYCTLTDIKAHIPEENLIQLTDDEGLGSVNQTRVNEAITYADELIDGYLRGRYILPLSSVPALLKKLSIDLTVFYLYSRRLELEMPQGMADRYNNTVKLLKQIQDGTITLGDASGPTPEPSEGEYKTIKTLGDEDGEKIFSKDVLDKY